MRILITLVFIFFAGLASTAWTYNRVISARYACENGEHLTIDQQENSIRLHTDSGVFVLPQVPSATGIRYSDGRTEFWSRGDKARLKKVEEHTKMYCIRAS